MSDDPLRHLQSKFAIVSLTIGILVGVLGFVKSWVLQPYRLEAAESRVSKLEIRQETDKYILIRIEERLEFISSKIKELDTKVEAMYRRTTVRTQ